MLQTEIANSFSQRFGLEVNAGEEDHARPGWTTSRCGQDSPWKSQSEWQRTEINGESMSMVWQTLGSRTAREQQQLSLGFGIPLPVYHSWPEMECQLCCLTSTCYYSFLTLYKGTFARLCSSWVHKKLRYRRLTVRCVLSVVIVSITMQQCRNYLYNTSWPNRWYEVGGLVRGNMS